MNHTTTLRRAEQGSALIVTMMVILAVTGLGAVAFTSAIQSTTQARNFEQGKQAAIVAELATMSGIEWLECNLSFLLSLDAYPYTYQSDDAVGCAFDNTSLFGASPFGADRRETPVFAVTFAQPIPARRAPEFDETFCYVRIDMLGTGGMFDAERAGPNVRFTENEQGGSTVVRRFNGQFYAGPVRCPSVGN